MIASKVKINQQVINKNLFDMSGPLYTIKKAFYWERVLLNINAWAPFLIPKSISKSVCSVVLLTWYLVLFFLMATLVGAPPEQLVLTPLSQDSPLQQDQPMGSNMCSRLADRFEKSECPPQAGRCLPLLLGASQVHEATPSFSPHCMDRLIKLTFSALFHHMHTDMACIRAGRYDGIYCGDYFKCVLLEIPR